MAIAAMGVASATAQTYPDRPIKLIVPFPPGGPPDAIARVIGDDVGKRINQTVVIDNRQGAGATIGSRAVAAAEPDGYTLLFASTTSLSIAPSGFKNVEGGSVKRFAPVAGGSVCRLCTRTPPLGCAPPSVFKNVECDSVKSFAPVAGVSIGPLVVVVHPAVPAKTVAELEAYAKENLG